MPVSLNHAVALVVEGVGTSSPCGLGVVSLKPFPRALLGLAR